MATAVIKSSRFSRLKKQHLLITLGVFVILYLILFHIFAPQPSVGYVTKVIDKIGAPAGFTVNDSLSQSDSGIGASTDVSRTYDGSGSFQYLQAVMLKQVRAAGFPNAVWINASGPHVSRIGAYCNAAAVNVYITNNGGSSSVQVEVGGGNNSLFKTNCPWL